MATPLPLPPTSIMAPEMFQQIQQQMGTPQGPLAQPNAAPQQKPQPAKSGFGGPGGTQQLQQIYGLLAKQGNNPMAAGQQYVNAMQRQQQLDNTGNPANRAAQMYGKVNPYDFETESMADFHEEFMRTGQPNYRLLKRRDPMSSKEQGFLNTAIEKAQTAESDLGRMNHLSNSFTDLARKGVAKGRLVGGIGEWLKTLTGDEDAVSMVRQEYEQLMVKSVVQSLPAGPASDKDIAIVRKGWPDGTADPAYVASFLRGMQKLRAVDHAQATHAASFIGRKRSQEGQLEDWNKNKAWIIEESWKPYGGVYNPSGDVSDDAASQMRFSQLMGGPTPKATGAPTVSGAASPPSSSPSGGVDYSQMSVDELLESVRSQGR